MCLSHCPIYHRFFPGGRLPEPVPLPGRVAQFPRPFCGDTAFFLLAPCGRFVGAFWCDPSSTDLSPVKCHYRSPDARTPDRTARCRGIDVWRAELRATDGHYCASQAGSAPPTHHLHYPAPNFPFAPVSVLFLSLAIGISTGYDTNPLRRPIYRCRDVGACARKTAWVRILRKALAAVADFFLNRF